MLFDFDNTLVDLTAGDLVAIAAFLDAARAPIDPVDFHRSSLQVLAAMDHAGERPGPAVHRERLSRTCALVGVPWQDHYEGIFLASFGNQAAVLPGVPEALDWIRPRARIGLVTNSVLGQLQRDRIAASGLEGYFDVIAIGSEVGAYKPDAAIFTWAAGQLDLETAACAFVGDSEHHDVAGARRAGMIPIRRFRDGPGATPASATTAPWAFRDYAELPEILQELLAPQPRAARRTNRGDTQP